MTLSPLKVASAYTLFARSGSMIEPTPFLHITLNDQLVRLTEREPRELLNPAAVGLTTEMMKAVTGTGEAGHHGTLRAALARMGLPVKEMDLAAKTGSGPEAVWAVALSKRLVVVTWLGYERLPFPEGQE